MVQQLKAEIAIRRDQKTPITPAMTAARRGARYVGSFQAVAIARSDRLITRSSPTQRTAPITAPLRSFAGCSHARYAIAAEVRIASHVQPLKILRRSSPSGHLRRHHRRRRLTRRYLSATATDHTAQPEPMLIRICRGFISDLRRCRSAVNTL
jgi:hypothetical protein